MPGYDPSRDAAYPSPWNIVLLSQRDVSSQIPINYTPHASVSLTPACFGNGNYTNEATSRCVSNLLSSGFRRFFIDVYWNKHTRDWQLCPVRVADDDDDNGGDDSKKDSAQADTDDGSASHKEHRNRTRRWYDKEQDVAINLGKKTTPQVKSPRNQTDTIGEYTCSRSDSWETLIEVFVEYLRATDDTLSAHLLFFILNPKSANPVSDSSKRRLSKRSHHEPDDDDDDTSSGSGDNPSYGSQSPHGKPKSSTGEGPNSEAYVQPSSLSAIFSRTMANSLYTPQILQSERSNLNKSWYSVSQDSQPISEYFTVVENNGHLPYLSTPDGWPCENYIEMVLGKRVLVAFGEASGDMSTYNYTADGNLIFPSGSLAEDANVSSTPSTQDSDHDHGHNYKTHIEDGCLYNSHDDSVNGTLNKWWYSPLLSTHGEPLTGSAIGNDIQNDYHDSTFNYSAELAAEIIDCGVSLLVNSTLSDTTADAHPGNYLDIVKSSIWSWADREPSSAGSASTLEDGRCAAQDLTKEGQWRARDCSFHFYGACRVDNKPYSWVLTNKRVAYDDVPKHCPNGSHFSVPRTPLENTYLYAHTLTQPRKILDVDDDDATKHSIWVDFNSIDVAQCWVVGHENGGDTKCPYHIDERGISRKHVIVPTVAAIIALAITALMMLAKCNVNRRNSRRKRVIEGWEYEGVPA